MTKIRYHTKVIDYIYKIEIPSYAIHNEEDVTDLVDPENSCYFADKFIILEIIHVKTKKICKELCFDRCNILLNYKIDYYKTYDRALNEISFFSLRDQNIVLRDDFPNVFTSYYYNGRISERFYHDKGVINGEYILYENDGSIKIKCNFINGIIYGLVEINISMYNFNNTIFIKRNDYGEIDQTDEINKRGIALLECYGVLNLESK